MKPSTQIEISARQELPYRCSACGADRGCNCNAPAVEKLKTIQENQRAASKAYRARQKAPASYDANIENIEELNGHGNRRAVVEKPNIPSRRERKRTAALTRLVDGLMTVMTADLARDLLGELKAHGATFLVEALEDRLSLGRDESGPTATDITVN
jgi:hypothetical protein